MWLPKQNEYYLEIDIAHFKSTYLLLVLVGFGVLAILLFFTFSSVKTKSLKKSLLATLLFCPYVIVFLFISKSLFLGGSLFLNRQFEMEDIKKPYSVNYFGGAEKNIHSFFLYDTSAKRIITDQKAISQTYKPGLIEKDTVILHLKKGLFGLNYFP
jgi:hypothetical protein